MTREKRSSAGFSFIELLIVLALVCVLAGVMIPSADPGTREQLYSTANIVAGDLAYARSLAVANNSSYRITFDLSQNKYTLTHTGANAALNILPPSPFRSASDPSTQQIVRLANLPRTGPAVRLHAVYAQASPLQSVIDLEFGPLGETTRSADTVIWLAAGAGAATRYLSVRVNAVTGLYWIENFRGSAPATS